MADVVFINYDEGMKRMMNNHVFYVKMLTKFKNDTSLNDLEAALAEGNLENAQSFAHTLKGTAGNLSLSELFKQSLELETQIKNKSVNPDQITVVRNVYTQTMAEIEKVITKNG